VRKLGTNFGISYAFSTKEKQSAKETDRRTRSCILRPIYRTDAWSFICKHD